MSAKRIAATVLALAACGRSSCLRAEQTRDVALGWRGKVDFLTTPCAPKAARPTKVVAVGSEWEAVDAGTEDFVCGDAVVHVRVSPAASIEIDFPASIVVGEQHSLAVKGDDGSGHKLDLGGQYTDTLAGVLERPACGDMDFLCGLGGEMLVARSGGRGRVTASFRGLTATRDVVAFAPSDAGAD